MRQFFASVLEVIEVALIAIGAVFLIRNFLVQPFLVSGSSMTPNFYDGDYLLIDELTYRFRNPERGEVSVFRYPNDETTYFIKRIIGLPGERLAVAGGTVTIYNQEHPDGFDPYQTLGLPERFAAGQLTTVVPESHIFVIGDNRQAGGSLDSRNELGPVPSERIIGKLALRVWPPSQPRHR